MKVMMLVSLLFLTGCYCVQGCDTSPEPLTPVSHSTIYGH